MQDEASLGKATREGNTLVSFTKLLLMRLEVLILLFSLFGCSASVNGNGVVPELMEVSTMSKLDPQLKARLKEVQQKSDQGEIPVILHFKKGADLTKLQDKGFKLEKVISEEIGAASGTLTPESVQSMIEADEVELLELDHEARALSAQQ